VQLIDAIHDRHLWSERYDRTLTNSIGLQGELATEIAHSLRARLNPEEKGRLASKPTNNPEAYVLYLQAREKERTALSSYEDSIAVDALYDRAVALDPQFASAMARQSLWNSGMYMESRSQERKNKAQTLAVQALRVAPDLPEAHMALGEWFRMTERNYDAALKELEIVARTMPNDPEILGRLGYLYRRQGRWREALANFHRAQELDPRIPHDDEAETAWALRDWKTARVLYRQLLELAPDDIGLKTIFAMALMNGEGDFAAARALLDTIPYPRHDSRGQPIWDDLVVRWRLLMLERDYAGAEKLLVDFPLEEFPGPIPGLKNLFVGLTAWAKGDQDRARERFEKVRRGWESFARDHPNDPAVMTHLGLLYAYLGRKEEALRESRRAVEVVPENDAIERPAYSTNLALVYALTGESEKAVTLIEQLLTKPAVEVQGAQAMTLTNLRSWRWDALRSNPRFQEILASPEPKTIY
jgi:Flp pilus assembly protein TadD